MRARARGDIGEEYAARWLCRRGCRILARNYAMRGGELDIVALSGETLLFVEVKTRRTGSMCTPAEAVDRRKRRRILLCAQQYIAESANSAQPRFDVAEVYLDGVRPVRINYIENAFGEED